jgi:antitoxin PrlF
MATSTLTTKGQITIPKEIREHLKLRAGHRLEFQIGADGLVVMRPRNRDVRELKGILRPKRRKPVSVEQMNEPSPKTLESGEGLRYQRLGPVSGC